MNFDISSMEQGLSRLATRADASVRVLAEQGATKMQNYAKGHHRWENRTHDAENRLDGSVSAIFNGYRITLSHGVDYGVWLELAHNKRFAIIPETINYVGSNEIMPAFNRLMEKL